MINYSFTVLGLIFYNLIIGFICFFVGYLSNKKNKSNKLFSINILVFLLCITLIFISFYFISDFLFSTPFLSTTDFNNDWCDYDSCSQEVYKWNFNGSACFDSNNPECQDFLRLWNVCQDYKNKIGVC